MEVEKNRREWVSGLAAASIIGRVASGQTPAAPSGQRQMKPLPFDPTKLKGLSEKLLRSHYEDLPSKLEADKVDPHIPWLYNFKLDFRFK